MKQFTLLICFLFMGTLAIGQCSYDSTITSNPDLSGGNQIQCADQVIEFTASAGYESYQWKYKFSTTGSPTNFEGETNNTLSIVAGDLGFAYIFVTITEDGCTEDSNEIMFDTWIFQSPAIEHDPDTTLCYGETSIISSAFPGPQNFRWYKDGELVLEGTQDFYEVSVAGSYLLEVSYEQCPEQWLSSGVPVTFEVVGEEVTISEIGIELITTQNGNDYSWFFEGVEIPGEDTFAITPEQTGNYTVEVTFGPPNCVIESDSYFFEFLSFEENEIAEGVFFKNTKAVNGQFRLSNLNNKNLDVSLYDLNGKLIYETNSAASSITIETTFPKGIYLCQIQCEGKNKTVALVN